MNASEIKFGIELETHVKASAADDGTLLIGGPHRGIQVPFLPQGWKAERDASIRCGAYRRGCEFVSPILSGREGVEEVCNAVDLIKEKVDGKVNSSCGIHITFTFDGNNAKALARLLCLFANHETAIYASTGSVGRSQNHFCKSIKSYGSARNTENEIKKWYGTYTSERYHIVNLTHLANGKNRIEVRAFCGSLNKTKIVGHIMQVLGMVELALTSKRAQSWEYKAKEGKKASWNHDGRGVGETEIHRMFYRLGWTKGHARKQYGLELLPENMELKKIKKEFIRLARKFDDRHPTHPVA